MSNELPPDWAIERAHAALMKYENDSMFGIVSLEKAKREIALYPGIRVLADYIVKHEEAPVDPLLIEALEIAGFAFDDFSSDDFKSGRVEKDTKVDMCLEALRRGIELGKSS